VLPSLPHRQAAISHAVPAKLLDPFATSPLGSPRFGHAAHFRASLDKSADAAAAASSSAPPGPQLSDPMQRTESPFLAGGGTEPEPEARPLSPLHPLSPAARGAASPAPQPQALPVADVFASADKAGCSPCDSGAKSTTLTLHWLSPPRTALVVCKLVSSVFPELNRLLRFLRCSGTAAAVRGSVRRSGQGH
jgi:hypothetical protein